jgi:L-lactate utilization protein LutB
MIDRIRQHITIAVEQEKKKKKKKKGKCNKQYQSCFEHETIGNTGVYMTVEQKGGVCGQRNEGNTAGLKERVCDMNLYVSSFIQFASAMNKYGTADQHLNQPFPGNKCFDGWCHKHQNACFRKSRTLVTWK